MFNFSPAINSSFFRGCYFQEGSELKMGMKVDVAYQKSLQTVVNWIQREVDSNRTLVFFRTYAPVHFRFVKKVSFYNSITAYFFGLFYYIIWPYMNCLLPCYN